MTTMSSNGFDKELLKVTLNGIALINQAIPKYQITLRNALKGNLSVELKDGTSHLMDVDEVSKLSRKLPSWMIWLVKLPFILAYNPENSIFKVVGDEWQEKATREVLGLDTSTPLKIEHIEKLVMDYGSLVFILFAIDYKKIFDRGEKIE